MRLGFSVYFGLDNTMEENMSLLREAHKCGFTRIFTSLHIPEANYDVLKYEVKEFLKVAKEYNMDIISDISPNTFKFLGLRDMDIEGLYNIGVRTIRIDFGYSEEEIAKMSKNEYGVKVQLNASTITRDFFKKLDKCDPNYDNVDALHNFYPRVGTGISEECMINKNKILLERGIKPCAFVQSNNRKRSPLKDGLPTLEDHRNLNVSDAANHLFALGNTSVFIGDSLPSNEELQQLSKLSQDAIRLRIKIKDNMDTVSTRLLKEVYSSRTDEARDAIRAAESRLLLKGEKIESLNCTERKYGDVTIDNEKYQRYMGELQILIKEGKSDERINVVASVLQQDYHLLQYIKNGKRFYFDIVN